jgi:hypothetical protein
MQLPSNLGAGLEVLNTSLYKSTIYEILHTASGMGGGFFETAFIWHRVQTSGGLT